MYKIIDKEETANRIIEERGNYKYYNYYEISNRVYEVVLSNREDCMALKTFEIESLLTIGVSKKSKIKTKEDMIKYICDCFRDEEMIYIEEVINSFDFGNWLLPDKKEDQTEDICLMAVKINGDYIGYIKDEYHTPEICLEAVKYNGLNLFYIDNQIPAICIEAIEQNEFALSYVKNQTEEMCLLSVGKNGLTLKYVHNQTPEICKKAVDNDREAIKYIKDCKLRFFLLGLEDLG